MAQISTESHHGTIEPLSQKMAENPVVSQLGNQLAQIFIQTSQTQIGLVVPPHPEEPNQGLSSFGRQRDFVRQAAYAGLNSSIEAHRLFSKGKIEPGIYSRLKEFAPLFLTALLDIDTVSAVMPEDIAKLTYLACELALNPDLISQITLTTGFGGNDHGKKGESQTSLGIVTYIIPALRAWENLASLAERLASPARPNLRFFWVTHAAGPLNGANLQQARKNTLKQMQLVHTFLSQRNPELTQEYVFFDEDPPWDHRFEPVSMALINFIADQIAAAEADNPQLKAAMDQLRNFSGNHNGHHQEYSQNAGALIYAAYHGFIFNEALPILHQVFPRSPDHPLCTQIEISLGSRAEATFNVIRNFIAQLAGRQELKAEFIAYLKEQGFQANQYQHLLVDDPLPKLNIRLIGRVGRHGPPYYPKAYHLFVEEREEILREKIGHLETIISKRAHKQSITTADTDFLGLPELPEKRRRQIAVSLAEEHQLLMQYFQSPEALIRFFKSFAAPTPSR